MITSILFSVVARERWNWSRAGAVALLAALFLVVDLAFFGANVSRSRTAAGSRW